MPRKTSQNRKEQDLQTAGGSAALLICLVFEGLDVNTSHPSIKLPLSGGTCSLRRVHLPEHRHMQRPSFHPISPAAAKISSGSSVLTTPARVERRAPPPPLLFPTCASSSCVRYESRSRMRRAITRHAASCWYSAWLSSWRTVPRLCRMVCSSNIVASHS